jgi:hypothetical protein
MSQALLDDRHNLIEMMGLAFAVVNRDRRDDAGVLPSHGIVAGADRRHYVFPIPFDRRTHWAEAVLHIFPIKDFHHLSDVFA